MKQPRHTHWKAWIKHAFAVPPSDAVEVNPRQRQLIEHVAREIVRRRLTAPALIALEMSRPLNFVAAQSLHFFTPLVSPFLPAGDLRELAGFLEQRGSVEYLCRQIELAEDAARGNSPVATKLP